jgi:dolichyl-phosphate-mannose-protein mannosyltransferase
MASVQPRRSTPVEKSRTAKPPVEQPKRPTPGKVTKRKDYSSEGVTDNDVFLLPGSDFQLLGVLTAIATMVRLFRIYEPTSVVFDEVQ